MDKTLYSLCDYNNYEISDKTINQYHRKEGGEGGEDMLEESS